jgi:hypothetical protein
MTIGQVACARCTQGNPPSSRFCESCGLPLGAAQSDASAATDILSAVEPPAPGEPDVTPALRAYIERSRLDATPYGPGWRLVVPLPLDRRQAVYIGPAGRDPEGRSLVQVASVCGAANERDTRTLLKLNARSAEGHFAIRVLRGEEYFIVIHLIPADALAHSDPATLLPRLAARADSVEDRLTRGLDLF